MQRSWCRALVATALILATASGVSAAASVSIERPAPGSAAATAARPTSVLIRDLTVPLAGAVITVTARAQGLDAPAKLATAFIVGSRQSGTRERSLRAMVDAPNAVLDIIARDPHATLTVSVCAKGGDADACTTSGPYPVSFTERGAN